MHLQTKQIFSLNMEKLLQYRWSNCQNYLWTCHLPSLPKKENCWLKLVFAGEKNAIDAIDIKRSRHKCYNIKRRSVDMKAI